MSRKRNGPPSGAFQFCNKDWRAPMDEREPVNEKETVIVERGGGGGIIAAIALLILVVAVLAYFGMLPI